MSKRNGPAPRQHKSKQHVYGGGKFESEKQRRYMWATVPSAARKWAHNLKTRKRDWQAGKLKATTSVKRQTHRGRR